MALASSSSVFFASAARAAYRAWSPSMASISSSLMGCMSWPSSSMFRHSDFISFTSTLKDSGTSGAGMFSPFTMDS